MKTRFKYTHRGTEVNVPQNSTVQIENTRLVMNF